MAIQSFSSKRTAAVFAGRCPKGFPADLFDVAVRKLAVLDAAVVLDVLAKPPGNRLEALRGDRVGQHSIRVNDQFRDLLSLDRSRTCRRRIHGLSLTGSE